MRLQRVGIQKMKHDIDFSQNNLAVIYAPNGTMKSSFTKTFEAIREKNGKIIVASIPFVRNLIEYTEGTDNPEYTKLTSLLQYKPDTVEIELSEIDKLF